jgi:beta-xylosidase
MGRETVMAPVTWKDGEWPYMSQINGKMSGWAMPPINKDIAGSGFVSSQRELHVIV